MVEVIEISLKDKAIDVVCFPFAALRQLKAPRKASRTFFLVHIQNQKISGPLRWLGEYMINHKPFSRLSNAQETISMIKATLVKPISRKSFMYNLMRSSSCWPCREDACTLLPAPLNALCDSLRWCHRCFAVRQNKIRFSASKIINGT